MIKNSLLLLFLMLTISCKKSLPEKGDDLIDFIKDESNGYSQTKTINGVSINLTYRPTKLMVTQEMESLKLTSQIKKDSLEKKYKNFLYFLLSYSVDGKEMLSTIPTSREQFNTIQNNLTFGMNQFVSLTNKKDTIPMADFISPRTYGMSKSTNVLLIFKKDQIKVKGDTFIVNIKDVGVNIGDVTFKYPTNLLLD